MLRIFVTFQYSTLLILSPTLQLWCATLFKDFFVSFKKQQIKVWGLVFLKEWRNLTINILMSLKNNNDRLIKSSQSALKRLLSLTLCVLLSVFPFDF